MIINLGNVLNFKLRHQIFDLQAILSKTSIISFDTSYYILTLICKLDKLDCTQICRRFNIYEIFIISQQQNSEFVIYFYVISNQSLTRYFNYFFLYYTIQFVFGFQLVNKLKDACL